MTAPFEFVIPGQPKPKGRPRAGVNKHTGRVVVRTPQKTRDAEETLAARALPFRPPEPIDGPIHLDAIFFFPVPKSWPKWQIEAAESGHFFHVKKPDKDNLIKLLKDALNGIFWADDSQICTGTDQKVYGLPPRIWVRVTPLEQMTKEGWAEFKARRER